MKTLEKSVYVYLTVLFFGILAFGILALLYGESLSIHLLDSFMPPSRPTLTEIDVILRISGVAEISCMMYLFFKKDISIDTRNIAYFP